MERKFIPLKEEEDHVLAEKVYQTYLNAWELPPQALAPHAHERWNPCPNPVTLDELNLPIVLNYPYTFAEKTDGVRVQFIVCSPNRVPYSGFIDRKGNVFPLKLDLPMPFPDLVVLDGEIVQGYTDDTFYFVMFDCIFAGGKCLRYEKDLLKRLGIGGEFLRRIPPVVGNIHFRVKAVQELTENLDVYAFASLPYPNDGLIFTPRFFEIPIETSSFLLKWKTNEDQSLDFRLVGHPPVKSRSRWGIELKFRFHSEERNIFQGFWFAGYRIKKIRCVDNPVLQSILKQWEREFDPTTVYTKNHFNCIVEVAIEKLNLNIDEESMMLKIVGVRKDKSSPNSELTIHGTLKTLLFPLSLTDLKKMVKSTLEHKNKIRKRVRPSPHPADLLPAQIPLPSIP